MSASSTPTLRPLAARPSARLTAVVDLPTPPLPEATAVIDSIPGTPRLAGWAPDAGGRADAGRGACGGSDGRAAPGGAGRGGGAAAMPRPLRSAVSATTAPATPGMAVTTRS